MITTLRNFAPLPLTVQHPSITAEDVKAALYADPKARPT